MQSTLSLMVFSALFGSGMSMAQLALEQSPDIKQPSFITKFDAQFKTADKDGDGALTRAEAAAAHMNHIVDNFDRLDVNKDGKVTREEMRALVRNRLSI